LVLLEQRALADQQDLRVPLVPRAVRDLPDKRGQLVNRARSVKTVHKEIVDHWDSLERTDHWAQLVYQEIREFREFQVPQDPQVPPVPLEGPDPRDQRDQLGARDPQEWRDQRVLVVLLEP